MNDQKSKVSGTYILLLVMVAGFSGLLGWWLNHQKREATPAILVETAPTKKEIYRCPMHPHIVSDRPGTCPICHMDLQKVEDDVPTNGATTSQRPEGRAGVSLNLERQQLIGVTYGKVKTETLTKEINATGKVAFDPELYTAIEEYRQAQMSYDQIKKDAYGSLKEQTKTLVESAKTKLKLMGFSEAKIRKMAEQQQGGMEFLLPDGKAWIYAEVFEYETSGLKIGQKLEAVLPSMPHNVFEGAISSINPTLNNQNRTIRVRAQVADPKRLLRPDSFMNVKILVEFGERLVVPDEAVLFSQGKAFVFVSEEEGRFEPRYIEVGEKTANRYEVTGGLKEGETIVTSANFLIDSESKLRSVLEKAAPAEHGAHQ
jgi:Cu(I)/Ag(I) efflux system membrane fusion protein